MSKRVAIVLVWVGKDWLTGASERRCCYWLHSGTPADVGRAAEHARADAGRQMAVHCFASRREAEEWMTRWKRGAP